MIDLFFYWVGFSSIFAAIVLLALIVRSMVQAWRRRKSEPLVRPRPYVAIRRPR